MEIDLRGLTVAERIAFGEWLLENEPMLMLKGEKTASDWLVSIEDEAPDFVKHVRERWSCDSEDDEDGEEEGVTTRPEIKKDLIGYT